MVIMSLRLGELLIFGGITVWSIVILLLIHRPGKWAKLDIGQIAMSATIGTSTGIGVIVIYDFFSRSYDAGYLAEVIAWLPVMFIFPFMFSFAATLLVVKIYALVEKLFKNITR